MIPLSLFNADDRAVSPASAVILMTVISVLLAATTAAVALGVGG
jgi:FlaG/FlaF family flagellin (archaellin)